MLIKSIGKQMQIVIIIFKYKILKNMLQNKYIIVNKKRLTIATG